MSPDERSVTHPHAPALGWARRLLGPAHVTSVFWFRSPYWAMGWLPQRAVSFVVACSVTCCFVALRQIRRAIASNIEVVLGPCGFWQRQRRIYKTMYSFGWCQAERYQYLHRPETFTVSIEGREHLEVAAAGGRGLIFVTAHIGHWETASHLISRELGREAHVVREEELDPRAQEFLEEILGRTKERQYKTHFASNDPRLGVVLAQALRRGDVVALQGDRPRAASRSRTVSLFGREMSLPAGPATLARIAGVFLLPIFSLREGRRHYRICLRPPIWVDSAAPRDAAVNAAMQQTAAEIEWAIRREPHQWFCFRPLWPAH
jgi:lauroyl/myristoyl acyltransferase